MFINDILILKYLSENCKLRIFFYLNLWSWVLPLSKSCVCFVNSISYIWLVHFWNMTNKLSRGRVCYCWRWKFELLKILNDTLRSLHIVVKKWIIKGTITLLYDILKFKASNNFYEIFVQKFILCTQSCDLWKKSNQFLLPSNFLVV